MGKLFTMSDNRGTLVAQLRELGLGHDEAKIYLELLNGPSSHLRLAQSTGVNRTKVYRLAEQLESRKLVTRRVDDRGTSLVAADPSTLEVDLAMQEMALKCRRSIFESLLPKLATVQTELTGFAVQTYAGEKGFEQMLWNELSARGEVLSLGGCLLEELVERSRWAEWYRRRVAAAGYTIRELVNGEKFENFTRNAVYHERYSCRLVTPDVLMLRHVISIYNDTVATYRWQGDQKIGIEIVDPCYAQAMAQIFDRYWVVAS